MLRDKTSLDEAPFVAEVEEVPGILLVSAVQGPAWGRKPSQAEPK